jgi:hypothetical protein
VLVEVTDLQGAADNDKARISGAKANGNMYIVLQFDSEGRSEIVLHFDSEGRSEIVLHFDSEGRSATYNCDGGVDVGNICGLDFHRIVYPLQLHLPPLVMKTHDGPVSSQHHNVLLGLVCRQRANGHGYGLTGTAHVALGEK